MTKSDFEPYVVTALDTSSSHAVRVDTTRRHEAGVVIVGAGTAGWAMARAIRELDASVPITMVTGCSGDLYDKPLLSVAMAKSIGVPALVKESGAQAAQRMGIRLLPETFAISVTPQANTLRTTRGALRYDHLVLAHGALPRMDERLPKSLCWAVNDLRCYAKFREALGKPRSAQQVVVIGAGLVGCEMTNDLALAGHKVVLVDVAERPLANVIAPAESAELLQAWAKLPITFLGATHVKDVTKEGGTITVQTKGGFTISANHVLSATGLQTPSRLAESAGLAWNNGIAVDPTSLATNVQNVHALGDCISINGQALRFIEPIARQARVIASRLNGCKPLVYEHAKPVIRVKTSSKSFTV
ncbi:Rubredoxin-NAD(+) reductase [bioreactor metagenome]|uniref:Rubredoxin-NAD(+) reductase n=1 Tax=bioreactor metagenome TaxID=1076179 RepID=A0A645DRT3_9ZZZZ